MQGGASNGIIHVYIYYTVWEGFVLKVSKAGAAQKVGPHHFSGHGGTTSFLMNVVRGHQALLILHSRRSPHNTEQTHFEFMFEIILRIAVSKYCMTLYIVAIVSFQLQKWAWQIQNFCHV